MSARPIDRLLEYIDFTGVSRHVFEKETGLSNGYLAGQIEGKGHIGSEILGKIHKKHPDLDLAWVVIGEGDMLKSTQKKVSKTTPKPHFLPPNVEKTVPKHTFKEPEIPYFETPTATPTTKKHQKTPLSIPVTDISVAAGSGHFNADYIEAQEAIVLPPHMVTSGLHLCVRARGQSMAPTIQDGSYCIIRMLEKSDWLNAPDEHVYVITDSTGASYIKRVKNRLGKGFIVCMSDSPEKSTYPNFNLQIDEIVNLWHVEWYIAARLPNIHNQYYSRLQELEDQIAEIWNEIAPKKHKN